MSNEKKERFRLSFLSFVFNVFFAFFLSSTALCFAKTFMIFLMLYKLIS